MMVSNFNEKGFPMITIHDKIGHGFKGIRKDGRIFRGVVQDVRTVAKGTLVVIRQLDNAHKSFYMEDITGGWSTTLMNGQPVILN